MKNFSYKLATTFIFAIVIIISISDATAAFRGGAYRNYNGTARYNNDGFNGDNVTNNDRGTYYYHGVPYNYYYRGRYYNYYYNGAYYNNCKEVPGYWSYGYWYAASTVCW